MSRKIAQQWLDKVVSTVEAQDFPGHINLISRRVNLTGVPDFDSIGYDAWTTQCKHEFDNNLLKSVHYRSLKLQVKTDKNVMFKTIETVEGTDGTVNEQGIEVLLEKENDGVWRVIQERILSQEEVLHDKLEE